MGKTSFHDTVTFVAEEETQGSNESPSPPSPPSSPSPPQDLEWRKRHDSLSTVATFSEEDLIQDHQDDVAINGWNAADEWKIRKDDFRMARAMRRRYRPRGPWGVFGLYGYVADAKLDLEWAQDAAMRRREGLPHLPWTHFVPPSQLVARKLPPFTTTMVIVTSLVMLVSLAKNGYKVESLSDNMMLGPTSDVLIDMGALSTLKITQDGQYFRLLESMVLYAGLIHYAINILALYLVVRPLERNHSAARTATVYVTAGIASNTTSALLSPQNVTVGTPGALLAMLGMSLAEVVTNWDLVERTHRDPELHDPFPSCKACLFLLLELGAVFGVGLTPYFDNIAHISGFFYGFCLGFVLLPNASLASNFFVDEETRATALLGRTKRHGRILRSVLARGATALVSMLLFTLTFAELSKTDGVPTVCPKCQYLSCIPFPFWIEEKDKNNDNNDDDDESVNSLWWHCDICDLARANLLVDPQNEEATLELICPYGDIVTFPVEYGTEAHDLNKALPDYCRDHCELL